MGRRVWKRAWKRRREVLTMCMTCGCGEPHEDHGNPDNITYEDLERAGQAANIQAEKALENMRDAINNV